MTEQSKSASPTFGSLAAGLLVVASSFIASVAMAQTEPDPPAEEIEVERPDAMSSAMSGLTKGDQKRVRSAFSDDKAKPLSVNVDSHLGAMIPRSVMLSPMPYRASQVIPDYEGREYFKTSDGRIIIVDPRSRTVVDVMR